MKELILLDLLFKDKHRNNDLKKLGERGILANSLLIFKIIIYPKIKLKLINWIKPTANLGSNIKSLTDILNLVLFSATMVSAKFPRGHTYAC